ncbi:hypothetical protein AMTRI_Chr08g168930 [Amborella trichopoda]
MFSSQTRHWTRLLSLHYFTLKPLLKSILNQLKNQPIQTLTNHISPIFNQNNSSKILSFSLSPSLFCTLRELKITVTFMRISEIMITINLPRAATQSKYLQIAALISDIYQCKAIGNNI